MKKLLLIINPVAGKGRGKSRLFEATDIFTKNGYRVTVMPTEYGKTEAMVAEEAVNYDLVVAIGGDKYPVRGIIIYIMYFLFFILVFIS